MIDKKSFFVIHEQGNDDTGDGSRQKPFQTFARLMSELGEYDLDNDTEVTVLLRETLSEVQIDLRHFAFGKEINER